MAATKTETCNDRYAATRAVRELAKTQPAPVARELLLMALRAA